MSKLSDFFTSTGLTLAEAIALLDQELPGSAYKPVPGAVDLTDIDPNWMRKVLNQVFGICGYGWGYEYDPKDLEYRYESRTNARGNEYGLYVAVLTHLKFWYRLESERVIQICAIHATGASENANIAYAMKGAITNAIGNAVSNIGFQESVYLGLRSHKDFQKSSPVPAPRTQPVTAHERESAEKGLPEPAPADPGQTKIHFGKMKEKTLAEVWASGPEGQGWVRWCANEFEPRDQAGNHLKRMAQAFIALSAG